MLGGKLKNKMTELERLKRKRDKLISQREVREAKENIKAEIRREKHPSLYRAGNLFLKGSAKASSYVTKKVSDYSKRKPLKKSSVKKRLTTKSPKDITEELFGRY